MNFIEVGVNGQSSIHQAQQQGLYTGVFASRRRTRYITDKFACVISGMLAMHKWFFYEAHNEYDPMRPDARKIDKRLQAHMSIGGITPRKTNAAPIGRTLSQLKRAPTCAAGELCMKGWSADEMAELRAAFAGFGMSAESIDVHLHVLDNIATSWAEQGHGLSLINLTLSRRANYSFEGKEASVTVSNYKRANRAVSAEKAPTQTTKPKGLKQP